MSQAERQREQAKDKRRSADKLRKERLDSRRRLRGGQGVAQWSSASPEMLHWLISSATSAGIGVLFGRTRDGGALVLTLYEEGEPLKEYLRPSDDLDSVLTLYAESYTVQGGDAPQDAPTGPQEGQGAPQEKQLKFDI